MKRIYAIGWLRLSSLSDLASAFFSKANLNPSVRMHGPKAESVTLTTDSVTAHALIAKCSQNKP